MRQLKVGIVGGGIVGLAHAWSAAELGHAVTVFERTPAAEGASVRNFGMIWPIGQLPGLAREIALESRALWLELARRAGVWLNACGSIHLAHREDEWAVLSEFQQQAVNLGWDCLLLNASEVLAWSPAVNPAGLMGGLWSPTELCVNPRQALRQIPQWLQRHFGVELQFATRVARAESTGGASPQVTLVTAAGAAHRFDRVVLCEGAEAQALFPEVLAGSEARSCKLQMMKTVPQADGWRIGPHLAGGLTLRHYRNFEACPSLPALKERIASETPELDAFGIHVMASQNDAGEVVLGDSHEYGAAMTPFDRLEIDDLMLRELRRIIRLPDWTLAERWHGIYSKHPSQLAVEAQPAPGVHVFTAVGGTGMTMSLGLTRRTWQQWSQSPPDP